MIKLSRSFIMKQSHTQKICKSDFLELLKIPRVLHRGSNFREEIWLRVEIKVHAQHRSIFFLSNPNFSVWVVWLKFNPINSWWHLTFTLILLNLSFKVFFHFSRVYLYKCFTNTDTYTHEINKLYTRSLFLEWLHNSISQT